MLLTSARTTQTVTPVDHRRTTPMNHLIEIEPSARKLRRVAASPAADAHRWIGADERDPHRWHDLD